MAAQANELTTGVWTFHDNECLFNLVCRLIDNRKAWYRAVRNNQASALSVRGVPGQNVKGTWICCNYITLHYTEII